MLNHAGRTDGNRRLELDQQSGDVEQWCRDANDVLGGKPEAARNGACHAATRPVTDQDAFRCPVVQPE